MYVSGDVDVHGLKSVVVFVCEQVYVSKETEGVGGGEFD